MQLLSSQSERKLLFFIFLFFFFFFFFTFLPFVCQTSAGDTADLLPVHQFFNLFSTSVIIFVAMPVVGVASKLRQPSAVGTKPVHTALPIPSAVRAATSQGYMARQQELRTSEGAPGLSCQLSVKSEYKQERTPERKSKAETEESKICKVSGDGQIVSVSICGDGDTGVRGERATAVCLSFTFLI